MPNPPLIARGNDQQAHKINTGRSIDPLPVIQFLCNGAFAELNNE